MFNMFRISSSCSKTGSINEKAIVTSPRKKREIPFKLQWTYKSYLARRCKKILFYQKLIPTLIAEILNR